jgi:hypothetical protein
MSTEQLVARGLRSLGLDVRQLEVGPTKTPDLLVSDGTCTYLVEVKDKFPNPDSTQRRTEVLDHGGVWEEEADLAYQNSISKVIREGSKQLSCFDKEIIDFRLLWLHARHRHEDEQLIQFEATLYGTVDLIDLDEIAGSVMGRPCFFFTFSEFFKLKDVLDGAFVSTDERSLLCLNNLSPRFERLRSSRLCQVFQGVCDPVDRERGGTAYIADCDLSRKDATAVLEYVKAKYRRPRLIEFEPTHYSAEMIVPGKLDDAV